VQIEDSAGVRIVAYVDVPEVKPSFAIAAEPVYRHGANPGDYEFRGINVGRLFPDGSAVVSVLSNSEVVVVSPDGTTNEVLARSGQGPGDVTYVYSMFVPGRDSVLLADPRLVRLTLFVGDSIARMVNLPRSSTLGVAGFSSSSEVLLANRAPSRPLAGLEAEWLAGQMVRFEAETGAIDTVASYDHMARLPPDLPWNPIAAVGEVTGRRRAVHLHEVRPARDHLASGGRHGNADRALAGRARSTDRETAGARRGLGTNG